MWGWLFVALLAFAAYCTHVGIVVHVHQQHPDRMIALPSGAAALTWTVLSLTPDVELATSSGTATIAIGTERWLFAVFALLAGLWLAGYVLGIFPEQEHDLEDLDHAR